MKIIFWYLVVAVRVRNSGKSNFKMTFKIKCAIGHRYELKNKNKLTGGLRRVVGWLFQKIVSFHITNTFSLIIALNKKKILEELFWTYKNQVNNSKCWHIGTNLRPYLSSATPNYKKMMWLKLTTADFRSQFCTTVKYRW